MSECQEESHGNIMKKKERHFHEEALTSKNINAL